MLHSNYQRVEQPLSYHLKEMVNYFAKGEAHFLLIIHIFLFKKIFQLNSPKRYLTYNNNVLYINFSKLSLTLYPFLAEVSSYSNLFSAANAYTSYCLIFLSF